VPVPESFDNAKLNRRALLLGAVFLVGGAAARRASLVIRMTQRGRDRCSRRTSSRCSSR
jgi:hypothetical protein